MVVVRVSTWRAGRASADLSGHGCMLAGMFDPENRCDLCNKQLYVTAPVRTRCDQCVRYGAPLELAPPIREFGAKADVVAVPCTGCARDVLEDGTPVPSADGYCLSCRLDGLHKAAG